MGEWAFLRRVLIIGGVIGFAIIVWRIYDVLLLAFAAVLMATLLRAITDFISRHTGLGSGLSFGCSILIVLAIVAGAAYVFGAQVQAQATVLAQQIPQAVHSLDKWVRSQPWLQPFLRNLGQGGAGIASHIGSLAALSIEAIIGVLVLIFGSIYFGAQPQMYRDGIVQLFPPKMHRRVADALDVSAYAMRRWLLGQLIDMATLGLLSGIGLWIIGVPSALALGILTALSAFVPYVGAIASGALAVLVAMAQSFELGLWTLGLYIVIHQSEGHLIMPFVHRWSIALPPALGVFAVVGMGILFGPLGILFATPLTVVTFVLVKKLYLQDVLGEEAPIDAAQARHRESADNDDS